MIIKVDLTPEEIAVIIKSLRESLMTGLDALIAVDLHDRLHKILSGTQ